MKAMIFFSHSNHIGLSPTTLVSLQAHWSLSNHFILTPNILVRLQPHWSHYNLFGLTPTTLVSLNQLGHNLTTLVSLQLFWNSA